MKSRDQSFFLAVELGMLIENGRQIKGLSPTEAAIRIGICENHIAGMAHGDCTEFDHELEMLAVKLKIYASKLGRL